MAPFCKNPTLSIYAKTRRTTSKPDPQVSICRVETRLRVDFSDPYYRATARFVARRDSTLRDAVPEAIEGKKVAILPRTAHEQYLKAFFTEAELKPYPTMELARDALRKGEVDLLFGDGIALAF